MFTFKVLFLCFSISVVLGNKLPSHYVGLIEYCRSEIKITDEEMSQLDQRNMSTKPFSQNQKCFLACILRKLNLMTNGTFLAKNAYELNKEEMSLDVTQSKILEEIIYGCAEEVQSLTNECVIAGTVMPCIWSKIYKAHLFVKQAIVQDQTNKQDDIL